MPGMLMSVSAISMSGWRRSCSSAASPSPAKTNSKTPLRICWRKRCFISTATSGSSSTTRILLARSPRPPTCAAAAVNADAISRAEGYRRAGSRASARSKNASKSGPSSGTAFDGAGMGSVQIWMSSSPNASASKGRRPVSARYVTTASDHRSLRKSTPREPRTCSGLM